MNLNEVMSIIGSEKVSIKQSAGVSKVAHTRAIVPAPEPPKMSSKDALMQLEAAKALTQSRQFKPTTIDAMRQSIHSKEESSAGVRATSGHDMYNQHPTKNTFSYQTDSGERMHSSLLRMQPVKDAERENRKVLLSQDPTRTLADRSAEDRTSDRDGNDKQCSPRLLASDPGGSPRDGTASSMIGTAIIEAELARVRAGNRFNWHDCASVRRQYPVNLAQYQ